jgi:SulP family sulfate permease
VDAVNTTDPSLSDDDKSPDDAKPAESAPEPVHHHKQTFAQSIFTNLLAGLTVSFVAISLGAAFGIASGRKDGAFVGILSAGVIAFITSMFGGTRIQCSGPTAPMTAVTAALVVAVTTGTSAAAVAELGVSPHIFINQVLILTGIMLVIAGVIRAGKLITLVPKVVISGFMNGIAVLIWVAEIGKLFGVFGQTVIGGQMAFNLGVAAVTTVLCFVAVPFVHKTLPKFLHFLPGALLAIVVVTAVVAVTGMTAAQMEFISLAKVSSVADITRLFSGQTPDNWGLPVLLLALPFAANLTFLCYLDTLLTALVADRMATDIFQKPEVTKKNKELAAQGLANGAVAFFGGIPGAQATIRTVLILNERATWRMAGVAVGVFVMIEMFLFQGMLELIPKAVFTGVLLKVGYDVMDWGPIVAWIKGLTGKPTGMRVSHPQMGIIGGVTATTVFVNLNVAVIAFTVGYHVLRRIGRRIPDLDQPLEFHDGAEEELTEARGTDLFPEEEDAA